MNTKEKRDPGEIFGKKLILSQNIFWEKPIISIDLLIFPKFQLENVVYLRPVRLFSKNVLKWM